MNFVERRDTRSLYFTLKYPKDLRSITPTGEDVQIWTGLLEVFLNFTIPCVFTNRSKIVSTLSPQKNLATPVPHSDSQKGALNPDQ